MTKLNTFVCFAVCGVFILILQTGNSLKCYSCNSHVNKECAYKGNLTNFSINCPEKQGPNIQMSCRKIVQTIDFEVNGLPPDSRVVRSCAYERQEIDKCYQRSGFGGRQEVCACDKDECNQSNINKFNYGVLSMNIVLVYVLGFSINL